MGKFGIQIELTSETLIDVILTSDRLKVLKSGTFDPAIYQIIKLYTQ